MFGRKKLDELTAKGPKMKYADVEGLRKDLLTSAKTASVDLRVDRTTDKGTVYAKISGDTDGAESLFLLGRYFPDQVLTSGNYSLEAKGDTIKIESIDGKDKADVRVRERADLSKSFAKNQTALVQA